MKRRHIATGAVALTTAVAMAGAGASMAHAAGNSSHDVRLNDSAIQSAPNGADVTYHTASATSRPMSLTLQLPQRNQALLNSILAKGTVISPAEYRAQFGASPKQLDKVTAWAKSQSFTVTDVSASSGQVSVTGNVGAVNRAFGVQMRNASLGSTSGLAADSAPKVPASLGVSGVAGLSTLHRMQPANARRNGSNKIALPKASAHSNHSTARQHSTTFGNRTNAGTVSDGSTECSSYWGQHLYPSAKKYDQESNYMCGYTPQQLVKLYGSTTAQKQSPTIGILLWGNDTRMKTTANDFFTKAKYPTLSNYTADAVKNDGQCDVAYDEQAIDVEMSHIVAPKSPIIYYGAANCGDRTLAAKFQQAVDAHKVSTLSMSFGSTTDAGLTSADIAAWQRPMQQASATGISVFASSGDYGTNATASDDGKAGVGTPASFPLVTAVGGTSVGLAQNGSQPVLAGWEERVYSQPVPSKATFKDVTNDSANLPVSGAGGGISTTFAQPTWQKGKVTGSTTKRAVPDVSAIADPNTGVVIEYTDGGKPTPALFGGTSVASPLVAAQVALAKAQNKLKLGNAAPTFYKLAGTSALKDVNSPNKAGVFGGLGSGGNGVYGFDAKPENLQSAKGWDNVTGVGTPSGSAFYSAFK